jgi:ubiquinone/menaquinone biosynthesis C-methylase UbiE/uncharacterized protein YbaR (Trm112 family)
VWNNLVSPVSGKKLKLEGQSLISEDGKESFPIIDKIAEMLSEDLLDRKAEEEIDSFEKNPVFDVCFFGESLFDRVLDKLKKNIGPLPSSENLRFAEYGGGAGYLASHVAESFNTREVCICDLSRKYLELAPRHLRRIRCDVRYPCIEKSSLQAAAFWVSLHHFDRPDSEKCLREAYHALCPGGVLILFEPNALFFPRKILMRTEFLRTKVYFDEAEKPLELPQILEIARQAGFEHLETEYLNPPYSWNFTRKLKLGFIFYCVTGLLHLLDISGVSRLISAFLSLIGKEACWGLYFLTFLVKK